VNYAKSIVPILVTLVLGACALLLVARGDVQSAMIFAMALVPSAQQLHNATPNLTAGEIVTTLSGTLEATTTDKPPLPPAARGFVELRLLTFASAVVAVGCALVALGACSWWGGGGGAKVADAGECIAQHALAGDSVEAIGIACFLPVAKVIESLASTSDPKLIPTPAARESRAARASMAAVDGGS
jgi:hypothetical protein